MKIIRDIDELEANQGGVLVPTMGALHEGHLALIRRAAQTPRRPIVVSVFVNPTQFGTNDDLDRYPRRLAEDVEAAEGAGADVVFAPDVEVMYPPDEVIGVPNLPPVAHEPGLEDACRPGHFEGVCQVVARLFDLVKPKAAVFGEKDYQQLLVIRAMVEQEGERWNHSEGSGDSGGALEIIAHETIRERDGLAMSSRNSYLDENQRVRARGLSRALLAARDAGIPREAELAMRTILESHDLAVEYAVVRDSETLLPVDAMPRSARALIAARLDAVRLIDNMAIL